MFAHKCHHTAAGGFKAVWLRELLFLSLVLCILTSVAAKAQNFVPFVIPAVPDLESPIAISSFEPINTDGDRITVEGGHFYRGGRRVRIWGVNLSFGANMPTHEDAAHVAARLAAAGVNSVRCHHMDTSRWPRGLWNSRDGKTIEPEALDRLDFFVDQLARRGICVNINLHVGRAHSEYLGLPKTNRQYDKITNIFTPALIKAQKGFARQFLGRVNPYRKVRYADDPAVAFVEITNENSFFMWGSEQTLRTLEPYYADILQKEFNAWLRQEYGSDEKLRCTWSSGAESLGANMLDNGGLGERESIRDDNVALYIDNEGPQRAIDRMRFLAETEKSFFDDMRSFIKNDLGCRALVTGTIVFGPLGLYAQSDMDFIDGHAYWQHPRFPGRLWDQGNWLVDEKPMVDYPGQSPLFRLAAQRLEGKPYTVSEYNHPAPLDSQAECVPIIASFGALQDWDGIWLYTYSHSSDDWRREFMNSFFDIDTNPAKWGFMRAGTAVFRDAAIRPFGGRLVVSLKKRLDTVTDLANLHLEHDRDMWDVVSTMSGVPERAELNQRVYLSLKLAASYSQTSPGQAQLMWSADDKEKVYMAAGGAGVLAGHTGKFERDSDGYARISSPEYAVITATPLDGAPWPESNKILITACGRCENTGMKFSRDRRTVGRQWGRGPVQIETVEGTVMVPVGRWRCQTLGPDGAVKQDVPVRVVGDANYVDLSSKHATMWYLLSRL